MSYTDFLEKKKVRLNESGFTVSESALNPALFPFQKFIVRKALQAGKYAIWADCGLGKTLMQMEWADHVSTETQMPVLIVAPLAVVGQTIQEGGKFGYEIQELQADVFGPGIFITNYENLHNIIGNQFAGVVLDESSILKNFEGETKKTILEMFAHTPYKLACTATPSPNDPMELGNHSEFLDIMSRNEMLAMYFVHDGGETSKWRIKGHATKTFYQFIGSWAIMLNNPRDIGFEMEGYDLPSLNFIEKQIVTPQRNNGQLFNDVAISATNFNGELRITRVERMSEVIDIVNASDENFLIWIKHNEEGEYLRKAIPGAVEVSGSDSNEYKKKMLLGFANGDYRVLVTKSKIASQGLNFQNCRNQIFASLDFSFEALYQSIRRSYRFGQKQEVNIFLITTDTMSNVKQAIATKQKQFEVMQAEMAEAVNAHMAGDLIGATDYDTDSIQTEWYNIKRGDCVQLVVGVPDESVGFSIFSPPFGHSLYTYSDHIEDMGNNKTHNDFLIQFGYLVRELYRVMKQGRNVAVHCMDIPIQKGKDGFIGLRDFSGDILKAFSDAGFIYHSRVTIWKDPVVEMQRTKALGLLHKQIKKDSTMSRVGIPDYLLIFRKDGDRTDPVRNDSIPVDLWQKYASPVWMDIDYGDTLNFRIAKEDKDSKHICPLQLPTIERAIHLYTNPGDVVFDPFGGIGSSGVQAIEMNRKALMFELKESYYSQLAKNCKAAVDAKGQLQMF